jgi:plastocyanin
VHRALVGLACAAVLAAAGCGGSGKGGSTSPGAAVSAQKLGMYDYSFRPTTITGKPGSKVTVQLKDDGKVEHNFSVAAQKIDDTLKPGESASATVTIPKSGTLQFYCKFHRARGMVGTIKAGSSSSSGAKGY